MHTVCYRILSTVGLRVGFGSGIVSISPLLHIIHLSIVLVPCSPGCFCEEGARKEGAELKYSTKFFTVKRKEKNLPLFDRVIKGIPVSCKLYFELYLTWGSPHPDRVVGVPSLPPPPSLIVRTS